MTKLKEWDPAYRGEGSYDGPPPWNIGEPQPEIAGLIAAGRFRGDVLDAGCGTAEASLTLAAQGHTVVGIDLSAPAVADAAVTARDRGLTNATYMQGDITKFAGYDGRFSTILDCTLFHSLPVKLRDDYLRAIHRAAAPGALLVILVFAAGAFTLGDKPNEVTEDELRAAVASFWEIDEIRPAYIHALPNFPGMLEPPPSVRRDEKGRVMLPAFLLTAHKAI